MTMKFIGFAALAGILVIVAYLWYAERKYRKK